MTFTPKSYSRAARALLLGLALTLLMIPAAGAALPVAFAAQAVSEADAVAVAANDPAFRTGLDNTPGWTAAAYDTGNRYGVWRVQFWNEAGDELGWADVSPARGRVYAWEAYFGATDAQTNAAREALRAYLGAHPRVLELVDDPSAYELYVEYDAWNRWWGAYLDLGPDSLYFVVRFGDGLSGGADVADGAPQLLRVYFANVLSYPEWEAATGAKAVSTAFAQDEIAAALVEVDGWTTQTERDDAGLWIVSFRDGERQVAWAKVDMTLESVVEFGLDD